ncbi:MAG: hypothetical protein EAZ92_05370 [Candidatus Kapaibacterium sp.]|nr:MAG: hypothetical protein EAZ92_05370 [Candidatus Kapabacteria bacterium]
MPSQHFQDLKESLLNTKDVLAGKLPPARVWHIDEKTGERTLREDNTEFYRQQSTNAHVAEPVTLAEND